MAKNKEVKELVKKAPDEENLPALMGDMEAYAGAGQASAVEDYALPFLTIIQSGSPQVKRGKAEYNEDAEAGAILNTVTQEVMDGEEGIHVIPVAFEKVYIEWKPREESGGLVAIHDRVRGTELELTCTKNDKNKNVLPNGNILEATCQHYVLLVRKSGTVEQAIISMSSTQLKKSRRWNTLMSKVVVVSKGKSFPAPSFGCMYHVRVVPEANALGDWFGWTIEYAETDADNQPKLISDPALFNRAKMFFDAIGKGQVKASTPAPEDHEDGTKAAASKVM